MKKPSAQLLKCFVLCIAFSIPAISFTQNIREWSPGKSAICFNGKTIFVSSATATKLLDQGVERGTCEPLEISQGESLTIFPNPANANSIVRFTLPEAGEVKIDVYNLSGQKVAQLFDGYADAKIAYDQSLANVNLQSGMYFIRMTAGNKISTVKFLVSK